MAWRHFTLQEFECKCGCGGNAISHELVDLLDEFREDLGWPLVVASGYRCPAHNDVVSDTGRNGPHTTGKAVDIFCKGMEAFFLLQVAMQSGKIYGIGISQSGPHQSRFIHLDILQSPQAFRPTIWSYS